MEEKLRNTMIISDYDIGYGKSAICNGRYLSQKENYTLNNLYHTDIEQLKNFVCSHYRCDLLIICSDGDIEIYNLKY